MDPSLTDKDGKQDAKEDDDEEDELHGHEATAFRTESQGRRGRHQGVRVTPSECEGSSDETPTNQSFAKSFHSGFMESTMATFLTLAHPLICFSRRMAPKGSCAVS